MKKLFATIISIVMLGFVYYYQEPIVSYIMKEIIYKQELPEYKTNNYFNTNNYNYVKNTDNFYLKNKDDIKNAIYTILNSGMESYNLYCEDEYESCLDDVEKTATDYDILANINNFVHPYNSYNKIYITTNAFGKVTIEVSKLYSEAEIAEINSNIETITKNIITPDMSSREKIKVFHDYIINTTTYDSETANSINNHFSNVNKNNSHKANGVLNNFVALCSGYTDLMAIFLSNIGIPNYKVSTKDHVWNAVYLDNNWYHLDVTWDNQTTTNGEKFLIHEFFLITTEQLEKLDKSHHEYNKTVYGF